MRALAAAFQFHCGERLMNDDDAVRKSIARRSTFERLTGLPTSSIDPIGIFRIRTLRIRNPDPPVTTGMDIIEQGKQVIGAPDVNYVVDFLPACKGAADRNFSASRNRRRWAWMNPRPGGDRSGRDDTERRRVD
jgi:hypothetical protein